MEWYLGPLKKYAVFSGRASRKEYWLFLLWNVPIVLVLLLISESLGWLYYLGVFLPSIALTVRRLHDTNRSAWWLLLVFVPLANIALLVFYCSKGTDGDNDYGADPLASTSTTPGPVVTGQKSASPAPPSGPPTGSKVRRPTGSSDSPNTSPSSQRERPVIKMKPKSVPEAPDRRNT